MHRVFREDPLRNSFIKLGATAPVGATRSDDEMEIIEILIREHGPTC
jgi:hypothetical protein